MRIKVKHRTGRRVASRMRVKARIRRKVTGVSEKPRICVYRSHRFLYAQCVDDVSRKTLLGLNTRQIEELKDKNNQATARAFGKVFGQRLLEKGVKSCVFDRSGYLFHGRIKQVADGIREVGVKV